MKRFLLPLLSLLVMTTLSLAQSNPGFRKDQVPTAAQWNNAFSQKQDLLNYVPLNRDGGSMLGRLGIIPSTTSNAGLNIPYGDTPTVCRNGDIWTTTFGLYSCINSVAVGPLTGAVSVNARDYGVVCDGTDESIKIHRALDRAVATNSKLILPSGVCVTSPLDFGHTAVVIEGQGQAATTLKWRGGSTGGNFLTWGDGTWAIGGGIRNLTIDGNAKTVSNPSGAGPVGVCVNIPSNYYVSIEHVIVQNCYSDGVVVGSNYPSSASWPYGGATFRDVQFINWGKGESTGQALKVLPLNYSTSVDTVQMSGGPTGSGTVCASYASLWNSGHFTNSNIDCASETQLSILNSSQVLVENNYFHTTVGSVNSVYVQGGYGNIIKGNIFYAFPGISLRLVNSSGNTVSGNNFQSSSGDIAIKVDHSLSTKNVIANNVVNGTWTTAGITETDSADYNSFTGNTLVSALFSVTGANSKTCGSPGVPDTCGAPVPVVKTVCPSTASAAEKLQCSFVGNGTSDQTAINSAIAAAGGANSQVKILPGVYRLTAAITVTNANNFSLDASGTVIFGPTGGSADTVVLDSAGNGSKFEFGTILTNSTGSAIRIRGAASSFTNSFVKYGRLTGTSHLGRGIFLDVASGPMSVNHFEGGWISGFDRCVDVDASGSAHYLDTTRFKLLYVYDCNIDIRGRSGTDRRNNANIWDVNVDAYINSAVAIDIDHSYDVFNVIWGAQAPNPLTTKLLWLRSGATTNIFNGTPDIYAVFPDSNYIQNDSGTATNVINGGGTGSGKVVLATAPTMVNPKVSGHLRRSGTAPTVSSCGSGASIAGTDMAGYVVTGTSATSCKITFATAYSSFPQCFTSNPATSVFAAVSSVATTDVTLSFSTALTGAYVNYLCLGD